MSDPSAPHDPDRHGDQPGNPAAPIDAEPQAEVDPADGATIPPRRDGDDGGDAFNDAPAAASSPSRHRPASYEPASLRHVDWAAAFPFVHLFRGFRVAVHPSKLILALAAVLLLYTGGRILDGLWSNDSQAFPGEPAAFDAFVTGAVPPAGRREPAGFDLASGAGSPDRFAAVRRRAREQQLADYDAVRARVARVRNADVEQIDLGDVKDQVQKDRDALVTAADAAYQADLDRVNAGPDAGRAEARDLALQRRDNAIRTAYAAAAGRWRDVTAVRGRGLFIEFYEYEVAQLEAGLGGLLRLDAATTFSGLYRALYVGPLWGFSQHPLYFSLFSLWLLVLAAVFGGAITRVAAVQVARDEKISLRSALRFSTAKFVSFLSAPLIPVLIIAAVGLAIAAAGALGNIPWLGEIVISVAFVLALLGGFLIALVLIGLVGGFTMMYPTVAAEGTDSFDAISRSFSYLFAKPWRMAFLAVVGGAYAAVTYLFVRLFLWLVLVCSHTAAGLFIFREAGGKQNLLSALWPSPPSFSRLSYDVDFINLTGVQSAAAGILSFWVYLVVALLAAYAVSLYFSLGTIVYFLMRREVDATELEEVYLDPHDEEYGAYTDVPDAENSPAPVEPTPVA